MPDYIFDTTALSNFAATNRLDMLDMLDTRYRGVAFTTVEVADELRRGVKAGYSYLESVLQQIETVNSKGWLRLLAPKSDAEHRLRSQFDQFLDPGEASCLALANFFPHSRGNQYLAGKSILNKVQVTNAAQTNKY